MKYVKFLLPRAPTATRTFAVIKILLLLIYITALCAEIGYTYYTILGFKEKVAASTIRSQIQIFKTHWQFFLFTGIWLTIIQILVIWAVALEYVPVLVAYSFGTLGAMGFQLIGAFNSLDDDVLWSQIYGTIPEPFLILFALLFSRMVKQQENHLANLPLYRRTMAESRKSSVGEIIDEDVTRREPFSAANNNNQDEISHIRFGNQLSVGIDEEMFRRKDPLP